MDPFSFFRSNNESKLSESGRLSGKWKVIPETPEEKIRVRYPIPSLRIENNVIVEYLNYSRQTILTYPQRHGRPYYQEGDIILLHSLPKHVLERKFPELQQAEDGTSYLDLLLYVLFDEFPQKYTYGWKIKKILPPGNFRRSGEAWLQAVLIFKGLGEVELEENKQWTGQMLSLQFINAKTTMGFDFVENISLSVCNLVVKLLPAVVFGGGGSSKTIVKKFLPGQLKNLLYKKLLKELSKKILLAAVGNALKSIIKGMLKDILQELNRAELLKESEKSQMAARWRPIVANNVKRAMEQFFSTLLKSAIPRTQSTIIDETVSKLELYLLNEVAPLVVDYILDMLVRFYSTMAKHIILSGAKFPEGWVEEVAGEASKQVQSKIKGFVEQKIQSLDISSN